MTSDPPITRRVPVLAVLSIVLAALPVVLTLLYFGAGYAGLDFRTTLYDVFLVAWNMIPVLWIPSIGFGIATVAIKRLGRWRIAGIPAILFPLLEVGVVLWFIATVLSHI